MSRLDQANNSEKMHHTLKAVIVEDDEFVIATMRARLARRNIESVAFTHIAAARDFFENERADLAIIDLGLPDGRGLDLIRFIRTTRLNKNIPVIIATANRGDNLLTEALSRDVAMFVSQKPIDWACLEYVIEGTVLKAAEATG
jgi:DNA-binding response OmpR family regulator